MINTARSGLLRGPRGRRLQLSARGSRTPTLTLVSKRTYYPSILPNTVNASIPEFKEKAQAMDELVADLESKLAHAKEGGGSKAQEKMRSKGKKLPRERCVIFACLAPQY
jgi:3-methylcrotonyl-CoA carboxylase beta subunit